MSTRAITPAKEGSTFTVSYHKAKQHLRVFINDVMVREVHGYAHLHAKGEGLGDFDKEKGTEREGKVFVGVMGCSPLGGGSEATFESLEYRTGVRPSE